MPSHETQSNRESVFSFSAFLLYIYIYIDMNIYIYIYIAEMQKRKKPILCYYMYIYIYIYLYAYIYTYAIYIQTLYILQATFDGNPKKTVTSCYSPTNTCEELTRNNFYTLLSETIRSIPKHKIQIVGGDMNAKIGPEDCNGFTFDRRTNESGLALLTLIDE